MHPYFFLILPSGSVIFSSKHLEEKTHVLSEYFFAESNSALLIVGT
jgi:hypothetical protein